MSPCTLTTITRTITALPSTTVSSFTSGVLSTAKHAKIQKLILIAVIVVSILIGVSLLGLLLLAKRSVLQRNFSGTFSGNNNPITNNTNVMYGNGMEHEMGELKDPVGTTTIQGTPICQDTAPHSLGTVALRGGLKRKRAIGDLKREIAMQSVRHQVLESEHHILRGETPVTIRVERLVGEGKRQKVEDVVSAMDAEEGSTHRLSPEDMRIRREAKRLRLCARMVRGMYLEDEEGGL